MVDKNSSQRIDQLSTSRRVLMKSVAAGGLIAGLSVPGRAAPGETVLLGDFEHSLDGWKTNGGNSLSPVTKTTEPYAVASGNRALAVRVNGDPSPMIERKGLKDVDFVTHPYFIGSILLGNVTESASPVEFTLRYHYRPTRSEAGRTDHGRDTNTRSKHKSRQQKPVHVEESDPIVVPQLSRAQLFWDMSDLSEQQRAHPKRFEITWTLSDATGSTGPRGRGPSGDYEGVVYFDNLHLTDQVESLSRSAVGSQIQRLRMNHGEYGYRRETRRENMEQGYFSFGDGTDIPVKVEVLGGDRFLYTIDGVAHKLGGGWE